MNVTDNHFVSDFFCLNQEFSSVEIPAELSIQDGEIVFDSLTSWINNGIELLSHLLTIRTSDYISFQEMFSEFPGSFREIMATISARKSGRINSGYGNIFIRRIEQVHGLSEGDPKIERFYPAEKFLECSEMGYYGEILGFLNPLHISDVFDEFPVVLVTEIFEQNQDEQLGLGVDLF